MKKSILIRIPSKMAFAAFYLNRTNRSGIIKVIRLAVKNNKLVLIVVLIKIHSSVKCVKIAAQKNKSAYII